MTKHTHDCKDEPDKCRAAETLEQDWVWEGANFWLRCPSGLLITAWALSDPEDGKPMRIRIHAGKRFDEAPCVDLFLQDDGAFVVTEVPPDSLPTEAIEMASNWAVLNKAALIDYWTRKSDGADFVSVLKEQR
jgi:hypothetical protein